MYRMAGFHKVSEKQFVNDWIDKLGTGDEVLDNNTAREGYSKIKMPARATAGSAGYDFYVPCDIVLPAGKGIVILTGIRAEIEEGYALFIFPRSGLGFKFRMQLNNTIGVIDSDYFYSDNEGHIMISIFNDNRESKRISLPAGTAFAQGIFLPYFITYDDEASGVRNGGFGSTGM